MFLYSRVWLCGVYSCAVLKEDPGRGVQKLDWERTNKEYDKFLTADRDISRITRNILTTSIPHTMLSFCPSLFSCT